MFSPNALVVRGQHDLDATPPTAASVAPLGEGYFVVRSRLRLTRDGGQSLLAVDAAEGSGRIRPVVAREAPQPTAYQQDPVTVGTPVTPPASPVVPPAKQASTVPFPPSQNAIKIKTVQAAASSSTANAPTRISLTGPFGIYAPLVRYLQAKKETGVHQISPKTTRKYFKEQQPEVYGKKILVIKAAIASAIAAGIVEERVGNGKPKICLVPGTTYIF